jgi:hypothetical protein
MKRYLKYNNPRKSVIPLNLGRSTATIASICKGEFEVLSTSRKATLKSLLVALIRRPGKSVNPLSYSPLTATPVFGNDMALSAGRFILSSLRASNVGYHGRSYRSRHGSMFVVGIP